MTSKGAVHITFRATTATSARAVTSKALHHAPVQFKRMFVRGKPRPPSREERRAIQGYDPRAIARGIF